MSSIKLAITMQLKTTFREILIIYSLILVHDMFV
jgi:hypothetical protein